MLRITRRLENNHGGGESKVYHQIYNDDALKDVFRNFHGVKSPNIQIDRTSQSTLGFMRRQYFRPRGGSREDCPLLPRRDGAGSVPIHPALGLGELLAGGFDLLFDEGAVLRALVGELFFQIGDALFVELPLRGGV